MQLETDEHWYSVLGFLYNQETTEQKLEIIQPHTRDSFLEEIFRVLKHNTNDVLKINLLVSLEENMDFFFDDKIRMQRSIAQMCELLNLPHTGPGPFTSPHVKCQILTTLTTLLIECDLIRTQPGMIESVISVIMGIAAQVNEPEDRIVRQAAAECLQELNNVYSGIFVRKLGQLLLWAQEEKSHAQQSYLMLFSSAFVSTIQILLRVFTVLLPDDSTTTFELSEEEAIAFENYASEVLGIKIVLGTLTGGSSASSSPTSSMSTDSLTVKLLDVVKTSDDGFYLPSPPPYMARGAVPQMSSPSKFGLSHKTSIQSLNTGSTSKSLFHPLFYRIYVSPNTVVHHMVTMIRRDLRRALFFMLNNLNQLTSCEALRLMCHVSYLLSATQAVGVNESPSLLSSSTNLISSASGSFISSASLPRSPSKVLPPGELSVRRTGDTDDVIVRSSSMVKTASSASFIKADALSTMYRPLLRSYSPLLWHVAALANFVYLNEQIVNELRDNLTLVLHRHFDDISIEFRLILLEWLYFLALPPEGSVPAELRSDDNTWNGDASQTEAIAAQIMHRYRKHFFPTPFDTLPIIAAKLNALSCCYDSSKGSTIPPPSDFLNVLHLMKDFTRRSVDSDVTAVVFRTLELYLRKFPELFDDIFRYIEKALLKAPALTTCLLRTISRMENSNDPRDMTNYEPFVQRVVDMLTSPRLPPHQVENYLDLISTISTYTFINPTSFLECLLRYLKCTEGVCLRGEWQVGNRIMSIINGIFIAHDVRTIFSPMRELLQFIMFYFGDVEIRDRAHFYMQLLTHVPGDKVRAILSFRSSDDNANDILGQMPQSPRRFGIQQTNTQVASPQTPASAQPQLGMSPWPVPSSPISPTPSLDSPLPPLTPVPGTTAAAFLQLVRLNPFFNFNSLQYINLRHEQRSARNAEGSQTVSTDTILKDYLDFLQSAARNQTCTQVQLPQLLCFKPPWIKNSKHKARTKAKNPSNKLMYPPGVPQSIYSIGLEFQTAGLPSTVSAKIQSVCVPFLAREDCANMYSSGEAPEYGTIPPLVTTFSGSSEVDAQNLQTSDITDLTATPSSTASAGDSPIIGSREHLEDSDYGVSESNIQDTDTSLQQLSRGKFPTAYAFLLTLQVGLPLPGRFNVVATYNEEDGRVNELKLEALTINLSDLFLPLPVNVAQRSVAPEIDHETYLTHLFDSLWRELELAADPPKQSDVIIDQRFSDAAMSVKFIEMQAHLAAQRIKQHLIPFIVNLDDLERLQNENITETSSSQTVQLNAFIFLPPQYHLLLKFAIRKDSTVITVVTDFWRVLTFVDKYFETVFFGDRCVV